MNCRWTASPSLSVVPFSSICGPCICDGVWFFVCLFLPSILDMCWVVYCHPFLHWLCESPWYFACGFSLCQCCVVGFLGLLGISVLVAVAGGHWVRFLSNAAFLLKFGWHCLGFIFPPFDIWYFPSFLHLVIRLCLFFFVCVLFAGPSQIVFNCHLPLGPLLSAFSCLPQFVFEGECLGEDIVSSCWSLTILTKHGTCKAWHSKFIWMSNIVSAVSFFK